MCGLFGSGLVLVEQVDVPEEVHADECMLGQEQFGLGPAFQQPAVLVPDHEEPVQAGQQWPREGKGVDPQQPLEEEQIAALFG